MNGGLDLWVEEMDAGGDGNERAMFPPTRRCKCRAPAFPPELSCVRFIFWFCLSKVSCGRIHRWGVRTCRCLLWRSLQSYPWCFSPNGLAGPRERGLPSGAVTFVAKAQSCVVFWRWMRHLGAFTDRIRAELTAVPSDPFRPAL